MQNLTWFLPFFSSVSITFGSFFARLISCKAENAVHGGEPMTQEWLDFPDEFEYSGLYCLSAEVPWFACSGIIHGHVKTETWLQCRAAEAASRHLLAESWLREYLDYIWSFALK